MYEPEFKMKTYLNIAQLYLEDDNSVEAEAYVNRASLLQSECKSEELQILYKVNEILVNHMSFFSERYCYDFRMSK